MSTAHALQRFSYADIAARPGDTRWELIDGFEYAMTPAPSSRHQILQGKLYIAVGNALKGSPCIAVPPPFDVLLDAPEYGRNNAQNVVQPDLTVICDKGKIKPHGCEGAPDLVVEILSPASHARDYVEKLRLYERFGVKEYWIVDPQDLRLDIIRPGDDGVYRVSGNFSEKDTVTAEAVAGLTVDLGEVFADLPI